MMDKKLLDISQKAQQMLVEYEQLNQHLDLSFPGDAWISNNIKIFKEQLVKLSQTTKNINLLAAFEARTSIHRLGKNTILSATDWHDEAVPAPIRKWRRNPLEYPYESIPYNLRKEVFDYYLRNDVHGELDSQETLLLSRGANEPGYFMPPTIVNVTIDVANRLGLFGYSDPLGHKETRDEISKLERIKRNQPDISLENVAFVMGGISGLDTVLSMLSRKNSKKGCVVVSPNYAPIIDNAEQNFKTHILELSEDYTADMERLIQMVKQNNISAVLLSVPHNPYGFRNLSEHFDRLHKACQENGTFIVCDEIVFDTDISQIMNPITYPNLVIISSYSKKYNIPGLKMGHLLANRDFVNRFYRYADTKYGSPASFSYLTATCLNALETAATSTNDSFIFHRFIENKFSSRQIIMDDFKLWQRLGHLHSKFQNFVAETCMNNLGYIGVEKMIGLDDPSCNTIIRMKGLGSTYQASMTLIAERNISVMPIECFSPPDTWSKRDLRVTIAVEPEKLTQAFPQLICGIDEIVAKETKSEWTHPDDATWLDTIGLSEHAEGASLWGRAKRTQTRLKEIFTLAGKGDVPEYLNRAATLLSIKHAWSLVESEQKPYLLAQLTGRNSINREESLEETLNYLLNRSGKLNTLPELPNKVKRIIFDTVKANATNDNVCNDARLLAMAETFQGISLQGKNLENIEEALSNIGAQEKAPLLRQLLEM